MCGDDIEILEHVLLLCSRIALIWRLVNLDSFLISSADYMLSFLDWLYLTTVHDFRILSSYAAYHTWQLIRNELVFNFKTSSARFIVERAHLQVSEYLMMTVMTFET